MTAREDDGAEERPHEPTERRLDEARRKGDLPRGQDLIAAGATAGLLAAVVGFGAAMAEGVGTASSVLIGGADRFGALASEGARSALGGYLAAVASATAALFALPAAAALVAVLAQGPVILAGQKVAPQWSRISPIKGLANRFGRAALFGFAKSTVKLVAVSVALGLFVAARTDDLLGSVTLEPRLVMALLGDLAIGFLVVVLVLQLAIGVLDLLWQRMDHRRKLRMSFRELREEVKESEGDPHLRAARRQRAVDVASSRMMADVPRADVVIVNPTHYAVALRWNRGQGRAPVCVAKGVDAVALRIRDLAETAGVPVRHDPPTARALHATVEVGAEILPDHYRAVAAAIRFAEAARRRARARGGPVGGLR